MNKKAPKPVKRVKRVPRQRVEKYPPMHKDNVVRESLSIAWSNILSEVLLPSLKDMAFEAVTEGANRVIYKEGTRSRSTAARTKNSRTNYNKVSQGPRFSKRDHNMMSFDRLLFDTRAEAQQVLDDLYSAMSQYGTITVAEFYDLAGFTSNRFTDENWGWISLRGSRVIRVNDGFAVQLPDPQPLD